MIRMEPFKIVRLPACLAGTTAASHSERGNEFPGHGRDLPESYRTDDFRELALSRSLLVGCSEAVRNV
jgi:hypothetical protein